MTKVKKRILIVCIAMFVLAAGSAVAVNASTTAINVKAYQGVRILYNGSILGGTDQPYIINGRTYVPLRLIMENCGKNVLWDSGTNQVVITDNASNSSQIAQLQSQITTLQNKNKELQNTNTTLNAKLAKYEDDEDEDEDEDEDSSDISISDIRSALVSEFKDAGDEYFDDDNIDFSFSLSGDEDDLTYTVRMDLGDSDYDDLTKVSQSDIEDFLDDVKSTISDEADGSDYEDADIEGKLIDSDDSSNYVEYDGSYSYSWNDSDISSISDLEDEVLGYFSNSGDRYFDDSDVDVDINLSGDEDDITFTVVVDCSGSGYNDLSEISTSDIRSLISALTGTIETIANNTDFEDADISGTVRDADDSSIKATYSNGSYDYSWE